MAAVVWSELPGRGPCARSGPCVCCADDESVVVFGGVDAHGEPLNDLWICAPTAAATAQLDGSAPLGIASSTEQPASGSHSWAWSERPPVPAPEGEYLLAGRVDRSYAYVHPASVEDSSVLPASAPPAAAAVGTPSPQMHSQRTKRGAVLGSAAVGSGGGSAASKVMGVGVGAPPEPSFAQSPAAPRVVDCHEIDRLRMERERTDVVAPMPRVRAACALAEGFGEGRRLYVFGGMDPRTSGVFGDLWTTPLDDPLAQARWKQIALEGPASESPFGFPSELSLAGFGSHVASDPTVGLAGPPALASLVVARGPASVALGGSSSPRKSVRPDPYPCARCGHGMCAAGTLLFVYGGESASLELLGDLCVCQLLRHEWIPLRTAAPQLPPRVQPCMCPLDCGCVVTGGMSRHGVCRDMWVFEPGAVKWREVRQKQGAVTPWEPAAGERREWLPFGAVADAQKVLVFGGQSGIQADASLWLFDFVSEEWTLLPQPQGAGSAAGTAIPWPAGRLQCGCSGHMHTSPDLRTCLQVAVAGGVCGAGVDAAVWEARVLIGEEKDFTRPRRWDTDDPVLRAFPGQYRGRQALGARVADVATATPGAPS